MSNRLLDEKYIRKLAYIKLLSLEKISKYTVEQGISSVAIYGMGKIGRQLFLRFVEAGIDIPYCIDINVNSYVTGAKIVLPMEAKAKVDILIITPEENYDDICAKLPIGFDGKTVRVTEFLEDMLV